MHHPTDRITHTTGFVTPVVEHWLEREIAQWVLPMKDRSDDPSHVSERSTSELRPAPGGGWSKGDRLYKGVRAVRPESVAGVGWFEVLWNWECPVGLSQKRNMCAFQ